MQNIPRFEFCTDASGIDRRRLDDFDRDGLVVLPKMYSNQTVDDVVAACEKLRHAPNQDPTLNRVQDGWRHSDVIREFAVDPRITDIVGSLYGRKPIPFQTLNFFRGSEQRVHCDSMHFSSFPPRFMCAVWVALEDVDTDNGPLLYYPGSHRLPEYQLDDAVTGQSSATRTLEDYTDYPEFLARQLDRYGYEPRELQFKKGDVLIWSSNLAHGGAPIVDPRRTRMSHITHFYFENCVYYTPRLSHPYVGRYWLRKVDDVATGETVAHRYRDLSFKVPTPGLYAFSTTGKPKPAARRMAYWNARARNLAKRVLRRKQIA